MRKKKQRSRKEKDRHLCISSSAQKKGKKSHNPNETGYNSRGRVGNKGNKDTQNWEKQSPMISTLSRG